MGTTEFVVAGLLPEIAGDLQVSVAQAGLLITVFAIGTVVGAPLTAMLTLRLPARLTLMLALGVFAAGHIAVGSGFTPLLAARFLTAIATGAFWAVANVAATRAAGPAASARALGLVGAGAVLANVAGACHTGRFIEVPRPAKLAFPARRCRRGGARCRPPNSSPILSGSPPWQYRPPRPPRTFTATTTCTRSSSTARSSPPLSSATPRGSSRGVGRSWKRGG
ncbi:MFS transporter [Streptomyces griseomycini]|uniref:MFS transporter n=1 Tax=Streptomyces griseomycini TaxID=66895 RepID=UPI00342CA69B